MSIDFGKGKWTKVDWAKNLTTIGIPLILFLIPCSGIYDMQMKLFFVSTVMAVLCFAFENVPQATVAITLPLFWIFFGVAPADTVFAPWTQYIPWYVLGGVVMAVVLEDTGLLKRIAFFCIEKVGCTYNRILIGIAITGFFCAIFIGDVSLPIAALCYGLCKSLGLHRCKEAAGIMMVGAISALVPGMMTFQAPIMSMAFAIDVTGPLELLGFFESLYMNLPLLLWYILCVAAAMLMFKPSRPINGKEYFREELRAMGKLSLAEKKAAAILIFYLVFLISQGFGGVLSLEWGMAFIPVLTIAPVIGAGGKEQVAKIQYDFVLFVTACMAIGTVAVYLGIGDLLVDAVMPILEGTSHQVFFLAAWLICVISNFVMTPIGIYAAFSMPLATVAQALGIDPMAVFYLMEASTDQIIFPYEHGLYMFFFAFVIVRMKDFMKMMGTKMVLHFVITFLLLIPWWNFNHFIFA